MKIAIFCHSLLSDWNHGNAHFLRGVTRELSALGHSVRVFEPKNAWSLQNLLNDHGTAPLNWLRQSYPRLAVIRYDLAKLSLDSELADTDLVIAHEWNPPELIWRLGSHRRRQQRHRLLFHDTHHRAASNPRAMAKLDLSGFDGVLAFGEVIRKIYLRRRWCRRAWTWHEAADTRLFRPLPVGCPEGDLVWIGNWGDGERTDELYTYLFQPAAALGLKAQVYGVRYPPQGLAELQDCGFRYGGWLPNFHVPDVFARFRLTVHIPRRQYTKALPGIPTIRPFEALACGIPLICAPWKDCEHLFTPGQDYLVARNGREMRQHMSRLVEDPGAALALAAHGLRTVRARHTCAHRADELLRICAELGLETTAPAAAPADELTSTTP